MNPQNKIITLLEKYFDRSPFEADAEQIQAYSEFIQLFLKWNQEFKFSKYNTPDEIFKKLIFPSLSFSTRFENYESVIDLGSGLGIPCVPLAIHFPDTKFVSVESNESCVEFMLLCMGTFEHINLEVILGRAEIVARDEGMRSKFPNVVAKSFTSLPIVLEIASALVKPDGRVIIQISDLINPDNLPKSRIESLLGLSLTMHSLSLLSTDPPVRSKFAVFTKTSDTDIKYPRSWKKMKTAPLFEI